MSEFHGAFGQYIEPFGPAASPMLEHADPADLPYWELKLRLEDLETALQQSEIVFA
jgi:hypothetical protein